MMFKGVLNTKEIKILSIEYLVLLTPSVIGSFSVLVVSLVRWRKLNEQVHLLVQLALADLLAALILMYTSAMNQNITKNSVTICQYILPLSLTFYFISFLLVVVYAWKSKTAIQGWRARPTEEEGRQSLCKGKIPTISVYAIVWLIPITIYFVYVHTLIIKASLVMPANDRSLNRPVTNNTDYCNSCILFLHFLGDSCSTDERNHATLTNVFIVLVVISVMLTCAVIYHKVDKWYEIHRGEGLFPVEGDGRSRRTFRKMFSTTRHMLMVIIFCWVPALVLILLSPLISLGNFEQRYILGVYIMQAAGMSLQGFLNSMVYAWRRPNFRDAVFGENTPLVADHHLAFFEESLSG